MVIRVACCLREGTLIPMRYLGLFLLPLTALAAEMKFNLVLEDNFEGSALNEKTWNIETGKRKDAMNTEKSVDVKNGLLTITTWSAPDGTTYCGFVTTRKKFAATQGKTEARCRFAVQPGTQVAFWAQSETYGEGGPSAAAINGVEIDILETTGVMKGTYQYALHWGGYDNPAEHKTSNQHFTTAAGKSWHVYGVEWDDSGYRFSFDGKIVATDKKCPGSKAPEYLLLTSESTIKSWNGERPKNGYGLKEKSKNTFEVDWVKAWERVPAAK